jgi:hypothetical protein
VSLFERNFLEGILPEGVGQIANLPYTFSVRKNKNQAFIAWFY